MKFINKYTVIFADDMSELILKVTEHLRDNWQPHGELIIKLTNVGTTANYWQVMTR